MNNIKSIAVINVKNVNYLYFHPTSHSFRPPVEFQEPHRRVKYTLGKPCLFSTVDVFSGCSGIDSLSIVNLLLKQLNHVSFQLHLKS